jgi:peptidoglycan-associated lipoprotein
MEYQSGEPDMMKSRSSQYMVLIVAASSLAACGKKPVPETPAPVQRSTPTQPARNAGTEGPSAADADAALRTTIANRRAAIENRIQFGYDRSDITPESQSILRSKVDALRAEPSIRIRIEGHADERGSIEYNLALGMRRAQAAREFLVGFGLDASRFDVASHGEDRPLDRGTTEAAYARNRRDEFVITTGSVTGRQH